MTYCITRQKQWPDGNLVVEVNEGGLDFANPDALVAKYKGEMTEFEDPREAVEFAIKIQEAWAKDSMEKIAIGYGNTLGFTSPFSPSEKKEIEAWAEKEFEALPKCPECQEIMESPDEWFEAGVYDIENNQFWSDEDGEKYCSESCALSHSTVYIESKDKYIPYDEYF